MGKRNDLSPTKVDQVAGMLRAKNMTQYQIAEVLRVSRSSVRNIKIKIDLGDDLKPKRIGACGRPRITSKRSDRKIRDICTENRKMPLKFLAKRVSKAGIHVSQRTVQRRLAEEGLISRRPARKPRLTPGMVTKRYRWAQKYKNFTIDDWKKVNFSDESVFQVLIEKSQFVRRRSNEKYKPECIVPTIKHPPLVMVWSVINIIGPGSLYIVEGTMNSEQYEKVLEKQLLSQMKKWFKKRENPIFMHDGAPCHRSKRISTFLAKKKITVFDWPGNCPDMNPIENVWEFMKREVSKHAPTTKKELIQILNDTWQHSLEIKRKIENCINSMPRRIEAVIAAKGGHTKY